MGWRSTEALAQQDSVDLEHILIIGQVGGKLADSILTGVIRQNRRTQIPVRIDSKPGTFILNVGAAMDTNKIRVFAASFKAVPLNSPNSSVLNAYISFPPYTFL